MNNSNADRVDFRLFVLHQHMQTDERSINGRNRSGGTQKTKDNCVSGRNGCESGDLLFL